MDYKQRTLNIAKDLAVGLQFIFLMALAFVALAWIITLLTQIPNIVWAIGIVLGFAIPIGRAVRQERERKKPTPIYLNEWDITYKARVAEDPCSDYPEGCPCTGGFRH